MFAFELGLAYDTSTKVLVRSNLGEKLEVVGIRPAPATSVTGDMVKEFYQYLQPGTISQVESLSEFRSFLRSHYLTGVRAHLLTRWFKGIDVHLEQIRTAPSPLVGHSVRFYRHGDGPGHSWVWKDTIMSATVLLI